MNAAYEDLERARAYHANCVARGPDAAHSEEHDEPIESSAQWVRDALARLNALRYES